MKTGYLVKNSSKPEYGTGEVVSVEGNYVNVTFENTPGIKCFYLEGGPLEIVAESSPKKRNSKRTKVNNPKATKSKELFRRIERDKINAVKAIKIADLELKSKGKSHDRGDFVHGSTLEDQKRFQTSKNQVDSLLNIREIPFHVMLEVEVEALSGVKNQLVYAHENSSFNFPNLGGSKLTVMAWTHPIVQLGMSSDLHEETDISAQGYTLKSVKPLARAKFTKVIPDIAGLYEPGGVAGDGTLKKKKSGLKAVKLEMTNAQVDAFLGKMHGMMTVTGAPGSGKTTVAMQRIRFLFDQQELRQDELKNIHYSMELTKIFLANQNLIDYSKELLEKDLNISSSIVELVPDFVGKYLDSIWIFRNKARLRRRKLLFLEKRGRQAFFGLCDDKQLKSCWLAYEHQISDRLSVVDEADWFVYSDQKTWRELSGLVERIIKFSKQTKSSNPSRSIFNMDALYASVDKDYEKVRELNREHEKLEDFDKLFLHWLYWVYDPLDGMISYFMEEAYSGKIRINMGIGGKIAEGEIVNDIKKDWANRTYGKEEEPWLAFLLRFVLPVEESHFARFREMANPLEIATHHSGERWTHVVIDEAQDLCVAEAALLSSFVHPNGALTVSADFNQVVSPVWGMENSKAFKIGSKLKGEDQMFPFAKNMRQSKQIGLFLSKFYRNAFGEIPPFMENDLMDIKGGTPLLMLERPSRFSVRIKQRLNLMRRNELIKTIALLQINEDEIALKQLRKGLKDEGVDLAPIWAFSDNKNRLITTSVERIKGLEYDACFVVGLDDIDSSALKYSINRAYVALSRPALQLIMLCEEMPRYLQNISKDYMTVIKT